MITHDTTMYNDFENDLFKCIVTSSRGQWGNNSGIFLEHNFELFNMPS